MAYNHTLAERIESIIKAKNGFTSKEMFGGIGYMLNGNMCVGINKDDLIVRFDPKMAEQVMKDKNVKAFDITGRPMKGWLLVKPNGLKGAALKNWFQFAYDFVKTLPSKK